MRIQNLSSGFGNQIMQYVFVRFMERQAPEDLWFCDDSVFFVKGYPPHDGYRLGSVFGVKPRLLSEYFDPKTWYWIIQQQKKGIHLPQIFLNAGLPMVMVEENYGHEIVFTGHTIKSVTHQGGKIRLPVNLPYTNVYYAGNWPEEDYFMRYKEENQAELTFPELTEEKDRQYAGMIRESMSVGIHVRRGDYVKLGYDLPAGAYYEASQKALDLYPDAHFFIFSDDLEWCRENERALGFDLASDTTYIEGNILKNYVDMQLLSMCQGIVRHGASTFSQLAVWLDKNLKFEMKL